MWLEVMRAHAGVLSPAIQEDEAFTFTMCNPPFFESMEEAGQNPATAFSGTAAEMVCPGGELGFVSRMVSDSLQLKVLPHDAIAIAIQCIARQRPDILISP